MILLGIDPGTRCAGYGIIKKEKQTQLIDYGYLELPAKYPLVERVGMFHSFFNDKIIQHSVTNLAIETPFLGKNVSIYGKLSYLRGILYLLAYTHHLHLQEFTPLEIKKGITGYKCASKEQVAKMVSKFFPGIQTKRDDTTDAIAIVLCGIWS